MLGIVAHAFRLRTFNKSWTTVRMVSTASLNGVELFKRLSGLPTYRSAQFQSSNVIRASASASDYERTVKRQSVATLVVHEGSVSKAVVPDNPEIIASQLSPSGKYLVVLREATESASNGKKRFVEVWSEERVVASEEVTRTHGGFYTDEYLASITFSPSEGRLAYVAEQNASEPESQPLSKYRFVPEFGEAYAGKKRTGIFIFDWASKAKGDVSVTTIRPLVLAEEPEKTTLLAHPIFASEDKLFAVGYEYTDDGRLLGVIYCPNRLSGIWELPLSSVQDSGDALSSSGTKITAAERSCRSPRVLHSNGSALLVWLSNAVGGPHASCSTLHVKDLISGDERVLVEPVWEPRSERFPGLFLNTLPVYPFLSVAGSNYIVLSSNWRSRSTTLLISLEDGEVTDLTPDDVEHYSWSVLATDGSDQVVCTRSTPSRPPELVLGRISSDRKVSWRVLSRPDLGQELENRLDGLTTATLPVPDCNPVEVIVVRTGTSASAPCITLPHGGPHGASMTMFNAWVATFALEGYTVAMPNYTGSTGFGEKFIRKLLGEIGSLDVEDCIATVQHLIDCGISSDGPGRQLLYGGSHGGFLIGHLVGQYPSMFSGGVLRNPVISLGEISTSDIPDWYYEECGISFAATSLITPQVYEKLFSMSPIAHIDAVQTPLVLLIGEKDQRVAPTQGKGYYHALKARGKKVDMFCLKDDIHSLDSVEGQLVSYMAAKDLFDSIASRNK